MHKLDFNLKFEFFYLIGRLWNITWIWLVDSVSPIYSTIKGVYMRTERFYLIILSAWKQTNNNNNQLTNLTKNF